MTARRREVARSNDQEFAERAIALIPGSAVLGIWHIHCFNRDGERLVGKDLHLTSLLHLPPPDDPPLELPPPSELLELGAATPAAIPAAAAAHIPVAPAPPDNPPPPLQPVVVDAPLDEVSVTL